MVVSHAGARLSRSKVIPVATRYDSLSLSLSKCHLAKTRLKGQRKRLQIG